MSTKQDRKFCWDTINSHTFKTTHPENQPYQVCQFLKSPIRADNWKMIISRAKSEHLELIAPLNLRRHTILLLQKDTTVFACYISGMEEDFIRLYSVLTGWVFTITYEEFVSTTKRTIAVDDFRKNGKFLREYKNL
jgi:hypothetical protein